MTMIIDGTNGGFFPSWTTATRPASPAVGQMGYNTTTGAFDAYTAAGWVSVASSATAPVNGPAFSAYQTAGSQTFSNGSYTKIVFNAKEFDTANAFDSTTNYRFTPQVAGYYQFNLAIAPPSASRGTECQLAIYKNGSAFKTSIDIYATATYICNMSALIYLNGSTDYIEGYAYFGTGGATANSNYQNTYLQGSLVRAA